ncbi:putative membrane protein [Propionispora sp. 2/2-37]|uniref:glycerol-3-phosphate 1-O-acyltransferase PlsY n=1 Tax=Propionispora sp. 2/2-37 TaxID=1677858 RepID=UPI0006BB7561|nr:glycerol-3-phosphate 1-O-acyltransferase PlsY [Propionispora sp. 2/2-37]CUH96243.1 putative membrane protein [Propionispora sp. 2/2-37]
MEYMIVIMLGYVVGSVPSGLLIGRLLKDVDLRQYGSKNIGATNAFRVLGPWPALCVFLADALKGVAGVILGKILLATPLAMLAGGIATMAGHNWSLFLRFTGGRGVATGLGVIAVLVPNVTVIVFFLWAVIVFATRYVSLASVVAAVMVPITMWGLKERTEFFFFGIIAAAFVVIRHKDNIKRLLRGEELKIKAHSHIASTKEKVKDK